MDELHRPHPNLSHEINRDIQRSQIDGGALLELLPLGKSLIIQTQNTRYTLSKQMDGTYTVEGHQKFCPTPTRAYPHGSTWGGSMLKIGFIGRGMHFECGIEGGDGMVTITTSAIVDVTESADTMENRSER